MDRAISPSLADEGAKLICCDLRRQTPQVTNQTLAPQTVDLILQGGESAIFAQVDISSSKEVEVAFDRSITV